MSIPVTALSVIGAIVVWIAGAMVIPSSLGQIARALGAGAQIVNYVVGVAFLAYLAVTCVAIGFGLAA